MKNKIVFSLFGIILIWLAIFLFSKEDKKYNNPLDDFKRAIIAADSTIKESDGQYSKLVDYYKNTSELNKELKNSNKELYDLVKKQNEKILNLTNSVITLQGKFNEGMGKINESDSNKIDLSLRYPTDSHPFILWDGTLDTRTTKYQGAWSFGKLPIQILVTEESRGLWKHRIKGPDWFIVDSLSVISLPPEDYVPTVESNIQFLFGGSYIKSMVKTSSNSVGIGVGINAFSNHNLLLNANTNKEIGLSYYYKFKSIKRRKE